MYFRTSVRPTRQRLLTAMGIATIAIAVVLAMLELLVDFGVTTSTPGIAHKESFTVRIVKGEGAKTPDSTPGDKVVRSLPPEEVVSTEITEVEQEVAVVDSPQPPDESPPVPDLHAISSEAAKASVAEHFSQEETRAAMWQQSHSIMFQPAKNTAAMDKEPLLSAVRFKRRSRVIGLGLNIGSCFIGIPVAGVPVEDRSPAITVFVCS
jgi:hypothetical protein